MRKTRRKWRRWVFLAILACGMTGLAVVWLMFQHIPQWYRPPSPGPDDRDRILADLTGMQNVLAETLTRNVLPFKLRVTQDQINGWLAIREAVWPLSRKWLPPEISQPFVVIDEAGIRLAATVRKGGVRTVCSARVEARVTEGGLLIRLVDVNTGALPVPQTWVGDQLSQLSDKAWPTGTRLREQMGGPPLPSLAQLPEGATFPAAWRWWSNGVPFEITELEFEPGVLLVTFQPLQNQPDSR